MAAGRSWTVQRGRSNADSFGISEAGFHSGVFESMVVQFFKAQKWPQKAQKAQKGVTGCIEQFAEDAFDDILQL
jgi:hypothetical protein